jgi:hypothetical protein
LQHVLGVGQAQLIAKGRDVAGHGAIAEGNEHFGPLPDSADDLEVILIAHSSFNEANVHVFGIFLGVDDRAIDELDAVGELDEKLIQVQERHVTAGATSQPDGGKS